MIYKRNRRKYLSSTSCPSVLPLHSGSVSFQYGSLALMHSMTGGPCSRACPGSQVNWTTAPTPYSGSEVVKFPFWR